MDIREGELTFIASLALCTDKGQETRKCGVIPKGQKTPREQETGKL